MTNLPLPVTTLIPDASLARTVAACMPAFAELAELIENVDGAIALRLVVARLRKSAGEPVDGYWARVVLVSEKVVLPLPLATRRPTGLHQGGSRADHPIPRHRRTM